MSKNQKNKTLVATALISSLISLGIHIYLALNHYKLKFGVSEGKSLCNINDHLNCDVVSSSKYASFLGYPIASWAAMTHLILSLFLFFWFLGLLKNSSKVLRLSTWMALLIAAMSVIMGTISATQLGTFCLFCIFTYVLSAIIAGCLFATDGSELMSHLADDVKSLFGDHKWMLFCLAIIPAGTLFSGSIIQQDLLGADTDTLRGIISDSLSTWQTNPVKNFNDEQGLALQAKGSSPAKVTVVEFADFLCPHCRALSEPMHNYILAHPGVRLVYKSFPLDGVCNDAGIPKHDGVRCELAYATQCAESLSKKGWETHAYIFEHQQDWDPNRLDKDLEQMAKELGYDPAPLKDCMKKTETHDLILTTAKEGTGILGTPTVFVNGRELPHGNILPVLDAAVSSLGQ